MMLKQAEQLDLTGSGTPKGYLCVLNSYFTSLVGLKGINVCGILIEMPTPGPKCPLHIEAALPI